MAFNGTKTREWKDGNTPETGTPALGSNFNVEFNRLYENDNYLKDEVDKLGGASIVRDAAMGGANPSDALLPSQAAIKGYVDALAAQDVKLSGNQTVAGEKTFSSIPVLPDSNPTSANQATRKGYVDALAAQDVKLSGDQTVAGEKTFSSIPFLPDSNPTSANQATRKGYVDALAAQDVKLSGNQTVAGEKTFSSIPFLPDSNPTSANQATRKGYVDALAAQDVKLSGNQTVAGEKTFSSIPFLPDSNPTSANQATRKGYVDALAAQDVKLSGNQTVAGEKTFSSIPVLPDSNPWLQNHATRKEYVDSFGKTRGLGAGFGIIYWKNGDPAVNGDRILLLHGQIILVANYPDLVVATYVGDTLNASAPAFYKCDSSGVRSTSGVYFKLPDARGLSLKMIGNAILNGRTKPGPVMVGDIQEDQMQGLYGEITGFRGSSFYSNGVFADSFLVSNSHSGGDGSFYGVKFNSAYSNNSTYGPARAGEYTRDNVLGTKFGIVY